MITTYKFKMKPTASQEEYFAKCFGCARFVYNHALKAKTGAYSSEKKNLSFFDLCADIRELQRQPEYGWLNDVPALTLNYSLLNLDSAYKRFFKTKGGFPHFKSKKRSRDAVKFDPSSVKYDFEKFRVRIPKLGWVKICQNRHFDPAAVKAQATTVFRDACGDYWCCVPVEDGVLPEPKAKVREETAVSYDVGVKVFAAGSDGTVIENPRFSETEEARIAKMQRGLARKHKGGKDDPPSKRYIRYRTKLARVHRHIENRRTDFLQKTTTEILRRYDTVCLEDLNVKGMMRNHSLAGAIGSVAWSRFNSMLGYKAERYGKNILRIGRFDASSQTCSACGYRNAAVKDLTVREWTCPQCGAHHDRDINAAVNIKSMALKQYFNNQSPAVTGITDADGADSENEAGTRSPARNYASDETSMK